MRKSIMSIQELEAQLLTLNKGERLRLSHLLTQSLTIDSPTQNISSGSFDPNKSLASGLSRISFGMFSGSNQSTEADFKLAEFHGNLDDDLNS
jgi:hypothetical protein